MTTVTKELIDSKIKAVVCYNAGVAAAASGWVDKDTLATLGLVTHCMIILENNFKVEGISACVDPARYNEDIGKQCAYEDAYKKLWQLEGYLLRQAMWEKEETAKALAGFAENNKCEGGGCTI